MTALVLDGQLYSERFCHSVFRKLEFSHQPLHMVGVRDGVVTRFVVFEQYGISVNFTGDSLEVNHLLLKFGLRGSFSQRGRHLLSRFGFVPKRCDETNHGEARKQSRERSELVTNLTALGYGFFACRTERRFEPTKPSSYHQQNNHSEKKYRAGFHKEQEAA